MKQKREYIDYLRDILDAAQKAERFIAGMDIAAFEADAKTSFAVIRAVEIIGEATKHIPASVRQRYPEVPWWAMAGMHDKVIHDYLGVSLQRVYETVKQDVPSVQSAIARILKMRANVIKLLVTGGVMTDGSDVGVLQWAPDELQAAIAQAHQLGRRVAGHCHGAAGVREAIRAGLDTVEHGTLLDDEAIALMQQHGTYYVPTLVAPFHICAGGTASGIPAYAVQKSHVVMERHKESVRQAHEVGVKIAMGTDCGTPFNVAGKNALELELLTKNGLSTAEALIATTRVAAEAIGIQEHAGTLEPGKWADVILVHGDPLDDIRLLQQAERITGVIKAGQIIKGAVRGMPVTATR